MSIILLFLFIAIFIIILIPTLLFSVIRTILSILGFMVRGKRRGGSASAGAQNDSFRSNNAYRNSEPGDVRRKKMFDKDEGEYVDFEEIKDEK